jgi:hypothetical protein
LELVGFSGRVSAGIAEWNRLDAQTKSHCLHDVNNILQVMENGFPWLLKRTKMLAQSQVIRPISLIRQHDEL